MLQIQKIGLENKRRRLLSGISAAYPLQHFGAILGPSGCGKTTLLKMIAGIAAGRENGEIHWGGESLRIRDFHASEFAYVPQFAIAHEDLTPRENVRFALDLRVKRGGGVPHQQTVEKVLGEVGMLEIADQEVRTLSGGQRRRLALAMELVSQPAILLCDEVTSGLDPQSEDEIVQLLRDQAHRAGRLVLTVTHSLAHLLHYDSVLVLFRGVLAYHGSPALLCHYFGIETPGELYTRLAARSAEDWQASWERHGESYRQIGEGSEMRKPPIEQRTRVKLPGGLSQLLTLLSRRCLVFSRSLPQILLQGGLILGFPLMVALFALDGLPAITNLSLGLNHDVSRQMTEAKDFLAHSSKVGSLVSGMVMFQVILLTLMGANNSGREIANERLIFEKERLAGLSPSAYVASKVVFLTGFVLVQSVWMGAFVHFACQFPGDLYSEVGFLLLVNSAITCICLGISSWLDSAEQASLASIYLVGFQLPLSGAVLALPDTLGMVIRPFISAYWSWSGFLEALHDERYYDIVRSVAQSPISPAPLCALMLVIHIVLGLALAWTGCERRTTL